MKKYYFTRCIVIVLSLFFLGGCRMIPGFAKKKISHEDELLRLETAMDDHLEKKYGPIVYRQKAFEGGGFDHPEDRWYLEAELSFYWQKDLGKGTAEFRVERRDTEEGEIFKDNFYGKIIRKEFEQWVEKQAKSYFSECKVIADTAMVLYPNELTVDSTLSDMLKHRKEINCFDIYLLVEKDEHTAQEFQEKAKAFVDEWEKQGIFTFVCVALMNTEAYQESKWYDDGTFGLGEVIAEYRKTVGD